MDKEVRAVKRKVEAKAAQFWERTAESARIARASAPRQNPPRAAQAPDGARQRQRNAPAMQA